MTNAQPTANGFEKRVPHNTEAERNLLAAVLVDNAHLQTVESILSAADFFVDTYRQIFRAMQQLASNSHSIDTVTLHEMLQDDSVVRHAGGAAFIAALTDGMPRVAPVAEWATIVRNNSVLRSIANAGEYLTQLALEPGAKAEEVVTHLQTITKIYAGSRGHSRASLSAVAAEELLARDIEPRQMLLDPLLPEQGLVMLYAYRGIGKTYLALGIAAAVASGGIFLRWKAPRPRRVLYVDGELPASTLKQRVNMILGALEGCQPEPKLLSIGNARPPRTPYARLGHPGRAAPSGTTRC